MQGLMKHDKQHSIENRAQKLYELLHVLIKLVHSECNNVRSLWGA